MHGKFSVGKKGDQWWRVCPQVLPLTIDDYLNRLKRGNFFHFSAIEFQKDKLKIQLRIGVRAARTATHSTHYAKKYINNYLIGIHLFWSKQLGVFVKSYSQRSTLDQRRLEDVCQYTC